MNTKNIALGLGLLGLLAGVAARAEESTPPATAPGINKEIKMDKEKIKEDRAQLKADREQLKKDRVAKREMRKERKHAHKDNK